MGESSKSLNLGRFYRISLYHCFIPVVIFYKWFFFINDFHSHHQGADQSPKPKPRTKKKVYNSLNYTNSTTLFECNHGWRFNSQAHECDSY